MSNYTPKRPENMIGNTEQREKLKQNIIDKVPTIVHGEPGIGKTTSIYATANILGYKVMETNASESRRKEDMESIYHRTLMAGYKPLIYLFDECDGIAEENKGTDKKGGPSVVQLLCKIIDESRHSIVFTANDIFKVPEEIKKKCIAIRYYKPNPLEVVALTRAIAQHEQIPNVRYDQVTGDVRASISAVLYGSEKPISEDMFSITSKILHNQPFDLEALNTEDRRALNIWLMENIPIFYEGVEMVEALNLLQQICEATGHISQSKLISVDHMYKLFPCGKLSAKTKFPTYFQRMGLIKRKAHGGDKKR